MGQDVRISFPAGSAAEQSRLAASLGSALKSVKGIEKTEVLRVREDAQDPGTILSIVLSGPAVVLAAKALGAWLKRNNQSDVTIERPDGKIILRNMRSEDVPKAIKALQEVLDPG
jgi:hypothetical protein